jgi:hydrogenase maturation protease
MSIIGVAMKKILIFGYGNFDRQDDGVAWHILKKVAQQSGVETPEGPEICSEFFTNEIDYKFFLQIVPEVAEDLTNYEHICFIDAHTGAIPEEIQFIALEPKFGKSPLTHHMPPETCLSITKDLYHHEPQAYLLSVRGYSFEFDRSLSEKTQSLADKGVQIICDWIDAIING